MFNQGYQTMKTSSESNGFIINPIAGKGKSKHVWSKIKKYLDANHVKYDFYLTTKPKEAGEIAVHMIKKGCRKIAVVGGDGTFHEAINGKELDLSSVIFGIIPAGTGNDFSKTIHVPRDPVQACRVFLQGQTAKIDLGQINQEEYFVNTAGVGFDAEIANEINSDSRWMTGSWAYMYSILKLLVTYNNLNLKVHIDDKPFEISDCFLLAIGNAKYIGGGIKLIPSAVPDDGYFHILIAKNITKAAVLRKLPLIYRGSHIKDPRISEFKAKSIKIIRETSNKPVSIHCDGEMVGSLPVDINLNPGCLNITTP